jgi:hypothetical protein
MRSNVICSFAAVFAAFAHFAAVFVAFTTLSIPAIADQPASAMATVPVTHEQSVRGVAEVTVEARQAI